MDPLYNAKKIAIVGISQDKGKIGSIIYQNLINSEYKGEIYLVNPKYNKLYNKKCYPNINEIPGYIDVVCIAIPSIFVKDILASIDYGKVKRVVIISAGFGEKDKEGKELEREILNISKEKNFRILGPNCLGYISTNSNINLSFASYTPPRGNIAFISQSGAICTATLDIAMSDNLGFSHFISIGNTIDLDEREILDSLYKDNDTKVIGAYLEEISQGRNIILNYRNQENLKPLIILKPGRSKEAQKAIQSHTGSIAGDNEILDTAFEQNGIISVNSINSLYNNMKSFSWLPEIKGNNIAIITNAGGPGIIATDKIKQYNLNISKLNNKSIEHIKRSIPELNTVHNPIDILGDSKSDRYSIVLEQLIKEEDTDAIIVILTPQYMTEIDETAKVIIDISKKTNKPILPIYLGEYSINKASQMFNNNNIPVFYDIDDAIEILSNMYKYYKFKKENKKIFNINIYNKFRGEYKDRVLHLTTEELIALPDQLIAKMLKEVDIDTPKQAICRDLEELKSFANDLYPVVLKVTNNTLAHKTDKGGIILNIKNQKELIDAYNTLENNFKSSIYLIQKQIPTKQELIIGIKRDGDKDVYNTNKGFGHLLMFGHGGIYTEVYHDYAYSLIPSTKEELINLIQSTKVYKILNGARGKQKLALNKLLELLEKIQRLVILYPEIDNLDINPVFIDENNVYAVDVKIYVKN